jgi:transcriptional regulator GlxA family with amidase domain
VAHRTPLRIGIIVTYQFTLNALANFVDVLRLASDDGDGSRPIRCQWNIMSTSGAPVRASCGLQVIPTSSLISFAKLDYIAVIGGLLHRGRQIDELTRSYLLEADKARVGLLGICTGSFALCRLGLMKERRCCISWYHYRDFVNEFHDMMPVAEEQFVVDGNRITSSGGVGAALAAAHLVERHLDFGAAQKALHIMQIERTKPMAMLQPAPPLTSACDDPRVTRALLLMEQNLSNPHSVDELASRLQITRRTLERLFGKHLGLRPLGAYMKLRLRHAHWMLRSRKPLAAIAADTGFARSSHFSAAFKREYGYPPSEERLRSRSPNTAHMSMSCEGEPRRVFDYP